MAHQAIVGMVSMIVRSLSSDFFSSSRAAQAKFEIVCARVLGQGDRH